MTYGVAFNVIESGRQFRFWPRGDPGQQVLGKRLWIASSRFTHPRNDNLFPAECSSVEHELFVTPR